METTLIVTAVLFVGVVVSVSVVLLIVGAVEWLVSKVLGW